MPRIPEELIERVREATDIVEIVAEHVQLHKRGRNYFGLCPFHGEKTPSFSVNPELQIYRCFGCGAGGNVFKFLQEVDHTSFLEAVSLLAQRHRIALPRAQDAAGQDDVSDLLYRANEEARDFYHQVLRQNQGRAALAYLRSRGLTDETIARFGLGYAPPAWDALLNAAGGKGLKAAVLEKAGLALPRQSGSGYYDRFRDRATFPIANLSGRTIGFGARALKADQEPKYLNSPETPIYRKSAVLYGLHHGREAIRARKCALIVEGYMDLLSLVQCGIGNVVASSGTALTEEHCRLLARYAPQVVLVFDGDAAGSAASLRAIEVLLGAGLDARVVSLPGGHDPDSFVRETGPEGMLAAVERAGSALDFHLEQLARQWDLSTLVGKAQAAESVKPLLGRCQDAVRRDLMLREVAQRLGVDERALRQDLQHSLRRQGAAPRQTASAPEPGQQALPPREQEFLGLLFNYPRFIGPTERQLNPEVFADSRSRRLAGLLFERAREEPELDLARLVSEVADQAIAQLIPACAMQGFDENQVEQQWSDYLRYFQREALTRRIEQGRRVLQTAAQAGREEEATRLSAELLELVKARQALEPEQSP